MSANLQSSDPEEQVTSVPFFRHGLGRDHAEHVARVLETPFLTSAGVCRAVEADLRSFFDVPHAKMTNSWTNGAVATLLALGVSDGDEVIVPATTFIASVNVVELVGAKPVFVDVDPATLLMDLTLVERSITPRTKAVIPVHLYGQMLDIVALRALCGPHIAIIEDCAHSFESSFRGRRPGTDSDAAIFSFYATKNVTCGEGGAIIMRDDDLMNRLQKTVLHGMSAGADRRFEGAFYRHWEMDELGTKANLPDLLACLLPDQIKTVHERRDERQELVDRYVSAFSDFPEIQTLSFIDDCVSAHHLFPVAVPLGERDRVLSELNTAKIGATVNYRAVHRMNYYARKYDHAEDDFPVAFDWGQRTLSLPLFPGLRHAEQDYVISHLAEIVCGSRN